MERLTDTCWRNLDPWECCGQDHYCHRGCHDEGGCTNGCIVPNLYDRLAAYEDTGLTPEEIERIHSEYGRGMTLRTSNAERLRIIKDVPTEELRKCVEKWRGTHEADDPLTLDELREMDGEPVWVESPGYIKFWALVLAWGEAADAVYLIHSNGSATFALTVFDCGGKAYRRKPEEV